VTAGGEVVAVQVPTGVITITSGQIAGALQGGSVVMQMTGKPGDSDCGGAGPSPNAAAAKLQQLLQRKRQLEARISDLQEKIESIEMSSKLQQGGLGPYNVSGSMQELRSLMKELADVTAEIAAMRR